MPCRGGWRRVRSGSGFRYVDANGEAIDDSLERIRELAIPPAWRDVWIWPNPRAKLQAVGVDRAGRRQYRYSTAFREAQEQAKYARLIRFGARLPDLRERMSSTLSSSRRRRSAHVRSPSA